MIFTELQCQTDRAASTAAAAAAAADNRKLPRFFADLQTPRLLTRLNDDTTDRIEILDR